MLAAKAQYSLGNAKEYFEEHLSIGDYYSQGQQVMGQWYGQGAEKLGLSGMTSRDDFVRLCENLHPQTGERLTLRQKITRIELGDDGHEHQSANRRVFYDFTFSPAKSVSIAAFVRDDNRIVAAHDKAVMAAMYQLQSFAATRVRKTGQCTDRTTANIVAAVFRHETSRALDPHLHSHCIVFNATFDAAEGQWKALQNHDMLVAQKFVENVYYHELARELKQFGYEIENQPRGDFEIKGVSPALREKFSKRHQEIDDKTQELLEREPEKADGNLAEIRDHIAHKERARKIKDVDLAQLRQSWNGQLTPEERESLSRLAGVRNPVASPANAEQAVTWAEEHVFDRHSVVHEHEILRHALEHTRGGNFSVNEVKEAAQKRGYIRDKKNPGRVTTHEHLRREWDIVCMAKEGQDRFDAFCPRYQAGEAGLDPEQRQAAQKILKSRSFVTLFRGGAGTGKSFTLREVERQLRQSGFGVHVIAPQRQQVMDLERAGLQNVETVSAFLARGAMAQGAIVVVDEAGQIGGKQMHALLQLVQSNDGRIILSGDTRQHGAVEATDALRAIEKYSGLEPVELSTIRRQDPALASSIAERERIKQYRQAVEDASQGKLGQSFERLEKLGAIVECTLADQHQRLADRYLNLMKGRQSTVIVSQTWNEIDKINLQIRERLKREQLIGVSEKIVSALRPVDLTDAQKRDVRSYNADTVIVANRCVGSLKRGEAARFRELTNMHLVLEHDGQIFSLPFKEIERLTVCKREEMALASGDRLQLKSNGKTESNQRLANGEIVTVKQVHDDGRITLTDGRILPKSFRQFVRGYAVTSYASQGRSVDHVVFSDSSVRAATNQQQWYVSVSRGKKGISIFTTDKVQLRENITRSGDRPLAADIAPRPFKNSRMVRIRRAIEDAVWRRRKANRIIQQQRQNQNQAVSQSRGIKI